MSAANLLKREKFMNSPDSGDSSVVPAALWEHSLLLKSDKTALPDLFETDALWAEANYEAIVSHFESRLHAAKGSVFHFGAGRGEMMESLRQHGFAVMGCESSTHRAQLARKTYNFDTHTLHCCNAEAFLRWTKRIGQKAQAIFFLHELEHCLELHALLGRMGEVLNEKGLLIALLPLPYLNHSSHAHLSFLNELAIGCASCDDHFEVVDVDLDFENRFMAFVLKKSAGFPRDPALPTAGFGSGETFYHESHSNSQSSPRSLKNAD